MTCFSTIPNVYSALVVPEDDDTDDLGRKARKKLREIEILKGKPTKTPEELNKIRDEDIWRAVVNPPSTAMEQTPDEKAERKRKQRYPLWEKMKILELKLQDERQKHKEELYLFKQHFRQQYQTQSDKMTEMKHQNAQLQFELRTLRSSGLDALNDAPDPQLTMVMEKEFTEHTQTLGAPKAAWHKMMLKYHPDRYTENKELADIFSKILNGLKERYIEN
jgi:hypothetical protein